MDNLLDGHLISSARVAEEREERIDEIDEMTTNYNGACPRIGKMSPGCHACFSVNDFGRSIKLGNNCNLDCVYCHDHPDKGKRSIGEIKSMLTSIYKYSLEDEFQRLETVSFSITGCEPFIYLDRLRDFMMLFEEINSRIRADIRVKIYTNGLPLNKQILDNLMSVDVGEVEIRFHPSASKFSEEVLLAMEESGKRNLRLTVEETLYPPNRELLLNHLEDFDRMGVHHLLLKQPRINYPTVVERIIDDYPPAKFFTMSRMYMYTEGLPFEIIETSLEEDYSYNMFFCNPETIAMRRVNDSICSVMEDPAEVFDDKFIS